MNHSTLARTAFVASVLALVTIPAPAHAKVCKDEVTAKSRSAGQYSDADRQSRARGGAMANWRDRARSTYGIAYRFWSRADDKSITCTSTKALGLASPKPGPAGCCEGRPGASMG